MSNSGLKIFIIIIASILITLVLLFLCCISLCLFIYLCLSKGLKVCDKGVDKAGDIAVGVVSNPSTVETVGKMINK